MLLYNIIIIGVLVYLILPLPLQFVVLLLNTAFPDPIPYLDEIIMYASFIKKLLKYQHIMEWIQEHKTFVAAIGIGVLIVIIICVVYFL